MLGTFLEKTMKTPPPSKCDKTILQPTLQEGTGSFVSGGPYGPKGEPLPPPHPLKI